MEMFSKRKSHWEIAILEIENAYIDPKILRRQYSSGDLRDQRPILPLHCRCDFYFSMDLYINS